jgi:hypothetical protein
MTAPGWFPDPAGVPVQRYWDGAQWTDHTAPLDPVKEPVTVVEGPNHVLHFILTFFTCGAWAFVWLFIALRDKKRVRYVR